MEPLNIVMWIIGGLMTFINILLGIGYKNMSDSIKEAKDKAQQSCEKVNSLEIDLATTKTNYVSRFSEVNQTINKVEKSILSEIRKLSETVISLAVK